MRWRARGTHRGGFPGASPDAVGREVTFTGTDILRIADGKFAEYWGDADSLLFVLQLGVREVPAYTQQGLRTTTAQKAIPILVTSGNYQNPSAWTGEGPVLG